MAAERWSECPSVVGAMTALTCSYSTAPPALYVLMALRKHHPWVFKRAEFYIDGGIRRGTDVVKALCLGAKAVGLGRPFLYALACGDGGVDKAIDGRHFILVPPCR